MLASTHTTHKMAGILVAAYLFGVSTPVLSAALDAIHQQLTSCQSASSLGNYAQAIHTCKTAIKQLGDDYLNAALIDDTPLKLGLAYAKEKEGDLPTAAALLAGVLESRLDAARSQSQANITLASIPKPNEISDVVITPFSSKANISKDSFLKLMQNAKALSSDDPNINTWHYSPWFSARFKVKNLAYEAQFFLGGRGLLKQPDGKQGMFNYNSK